MQEVLKSSGVYLLSGLLLSWLACRVDFYSLTSAGSPNLFAALPGIFFGVSTVICYGIFNLRPSSSQKLKTVLASTLGYLVSSYLVYFFVISGSDFRIENNVSAKFLIITSIASALGCLLMLIPLSKDNSVSVDSKTRFYCVSWAFLAVFVQGSISQISNVNEPMNLPVLFPIWQAGVGLILSLGFSNKIKIESPEQDTPETNPVPQVSL